MTDEQIRKAKYKCLVIRGVEGLTLADLFIKTANGSIMRPVVLRKNDYIQTNLLDFEDLKKSRLGGSLKRCVDKGLISEEIEGEETLAPVPVVKEIKLKTPVPKPGITEVQAGTVKPENISNKISEAAPSPAREPFNPYPEDKEIPVKTPVTLKDSRKHNSFAITEDDKTDKPRATNYEEFDNLKYFQKLKVIKESADTSFLEEVVSRSSKYPQLIHNAEKRLKKLKEIEA